MVVIQQLGLIETSNNPDDPVVVPVNLNVSTVVVVILLLIFVA